MTAGITSGESASDITLQTAKTNVRAMARPLKSAIPVCGGGIISVDGPTAVALANIIEQEQRQATQVADLRCRLADANREIACLQTTRSHDQRIQRAVSILMIALLSYSQVLSLFTAWWP